MATNNWYKNNAEAIVQEARSLVPLIKAKYKVLGQNGVIKYLHDYVQALLDRPEEKQGKTCSKGCSFCCHSIIYGTPSEMLYIRSELKKRGIKPDKKRSKIINSKPQEQLTWAEKKCPYLSDKNECRIYDFRPLVCRTHNSLDDPKNCDKSSGPTVVTEKYNLQINSVGIALMLSSKLNDENLVPLHRATFKND